MESIGILVFIVIFVGICMLIRYFVAKAVYTAGDKIQDAVQNSIAQKREENNTHQQQSLAEKFEQKNN